MYSQYWIVAEVGEKMARWPRHRIDYNYIGMGIDTCCSEHYELLIGEMIDGSCSLS